MRELGSCVAPISGEHLISQSVIEILKDDGEFTISGMPWQEAGEEKILAPQSLRTNCLCVKHNSALHRLDDAASYLFGSLKSFLECDNGFRHAIVAGHDIERWLLKTAKAFAVSGNFARGRAPLSGVFSQSTGVLDMLDNPHQWANGAGLYCLMKTGDLAENHKRFQLQPLTNDRDEIEALQLNILGLSFILQLAPFDATKHAYLQGAQFRPGRILVCYPKSTNWLTLSWVDGHVHKEMTLHYQGPAP
ncbi:hypothetical protein [Rhizobium lusitanum]|uniref:Uncharacterized protein n=1 Tax=Rhizobium lusitanum TaxID=293958 RepID=A0A1C3WM22_9HYPH|nr:hypothetical protein [Rhizobium lusitanum]SCB41132.1 hypothetical protein GA0061101_113114 [Rhizobium lusitanum]